MKIATLIIFLITLNSWAQTKITKLTYDKLGRMTRMAPGFDDSTFYYKDIEQTKFIRFCFSGDANNVCKIIEDFAAKKMNDYTSGDHDYLEIIQCNANENIVNVSYLLKDDYGTEFSLIKNIENCTKVFLEE